MAPGCSNCAPGRVATAIFACSNSRRQSCQPGAIMEPLKSEVTQRQVASRNPAAQPDGAILLRTTPLLDISATAIRGMLARHDSARYLLPDAVLDYIHEYQLYACT